MPYLEVRRHSVRDRPDAHLSREGRSLAHDIGRNRGPFQFVVSSPLPRAVETAEAMGFPPHSRREEWSDFGPLPWPGSFSAYRALVEESSAARALASTLRSQVREILSHLGASGQALVVTHGGFPEILTAAMGPPPTGPGVEDACWCLEGVYLGWEGSTCTSVEILRVPRDRSRL